MGGIKTVNSMLSILRNIMIFSVFITKIGEYEDDSFIHDFQHLFSGAN